MSPIYLKIRFATKAHSKLRQVFFFRKCCQYFFPRTFTRDPPKSFSQFMFLSEVLALTALPEDPLKAFQDVPPITLLQF